LEAGFFSSAIIFLESGVKQFSTQKKLLRHFHFFGLYLGVFLSLFIWSLSITGLLDTPSSLIYDFFSRITPEQTRTNEDILLVEADYESRYKGDETWLHLLNTLDIKGARQVVFFFFPENVSNDFYQTAADLEYVFFGREITGNSDGKGENNQLRPLPPQAAGIKIQVGALPPLSTAYGIHRDYQANVTVGELTMPHVALLAARQRTGKKYNPPNPFRVDFVGQYRSLPKISLSRIVSEDIIQELIKDKTVLVGLTPPFPYKGYSTPVTPDSFSMSPLEYHGLALQTLLNGTELRFPPPWAILACLLIVTGFALVVHQTFGSFIHIIVGGVLFIATPGASWLLLVFTKNWFPIVEVMLSFVLFLLLISTRDRLLRNKIALQILLDQSLKKQEKIMPKSFFRSEDYWPLVMNMIKQTLNIKRSILLEAVEGDHRVKEVIALNSSFEEIQERRRDYHRTPYKTAIEKNGAIPVDSYFKSLGSDEKSYLVPLNFFGQVQGFWTFTIDVETEQQTPELLNVANVLAREIGKMLFRRKQWVEEGRWRDNPLRKLLNMEKHHELYHEITRITAFLVRRLSVLESVFNAVETGTILYNPFGIVVQSNRKMTELLTTLEINAYGMSALDFAVHLTNESPLKIRQLLARVIVNHEIIQLNISINGDKKHDQMLTIRPLKASEETVVDKDNPQPFELNGFLFEITDIPNRLESNKNQQEIWQHSLKHLQAELEVFSGDVRAIFSDRRDTGQTDACHRLINKIEAIIDYINSFDRQVEQRLSADNPVTFRVDLLESLQEAIDTVQQTADKNNILFSIRNSGTAPIVQAEPDDLTSLLEAILSLLVTDALDDSTVIISVDLKQDEVICSLANRGVGMPSEIFQRFLTSPGRDDRIEYQKMHRILPQLQHWRAAFSGASDFGQGLQFKLILKPLNELT